MKDRLLYIITNEGLTASKFAQIVGIRPSAVSHFLAGRNNPGYDVLVRIIKSFPKYNVTWLMTGDGLPKVTSIKSNSSLNHSLVTNVNSQTDNAFINTDSSFSIDPEVETVVHNDLLQRDLFGAIIDNSDNTSRSVDAITIEPTDQILPAKQGIETIDNVSDHNDLPNANRADDLSNAVIQKTVPVSDSTNDEMPAEPPIEIPKQSSNTVLNPGTTHLDYTTITEYGVPSPTNTETNNKPIDTTPTCAIDPSNRLRTAVSATSQTDNQQFQETIVSRQEQTTLPKSKEKNSQLPGPKDQTTQRSETNEQITQLSETNDLITQRSESKDQNAQLPEPILVLFADGTYKQYTPK